jgi:5-methylcytosine-specific restriction protein B
MDYEDVSEATMELREMADFEYRPESSMNKVTVTTILGKVEAGHHAILSGAPGTGKTKLMLELKKRLESEGRMGVFRLIQFHPQYSYQDFVDGYEPDGTGFKPREGAFRSFVAEVQERLESEGSDSVKVDVLAIDELNRADVSSVFGEVMTLLDDSDKKSVTTAKSQKPLTLPRSVFILGTMNTADKSIALMDFALRRRFSILFIPPDYSGLLIWLNEYGFAFSDFTVNSYVDSIKVLNKRIAAHPLLGKGMMLGQSFFVPKKRDKSPFSLDEITSCMSEMVIPQLESYLGFGAQPELDKLIGIDLRKKAETALPIDCNDIVGLVSTLSDSKE